jgi:hypothetical protein
MRLVFKVWLSDDGTSVTEHEDELHSRPMAVVMPNKRQMVHVFNYIATGNSTMPTDQQTTVGWNYQGNTSVTYAETIAEHFIQMFGFTDWEDRPKTLAEWWG